MEVLRIVLHQTSANYRKEETIDNKMTYPLPPFSTVIGALHKACGYVEYHPMDISIQGTYESMHMEPYTDYCFLNSLMDDRGILVKMSSNSGLSKAYTKVAATKKSQGNSFRDEITIQVFRKDLLNEYQKLKKVAQQIELLKKTDWKEKQEELKQKVKAFADQKKQLKKGTVEYEQCNANEKIAKEEERAYVQYIREYEDSNYKIPISFFRSLTTGIKYYEILNNITLILHIRSDKATLEDVKNHIFELTSIGRSEDFVDVISAEFVNLTDETPEGEVISPYSAYISYESVRNGEIVTKSDSISRDMMGTKYYLNKNYSIVNDRRVFNKVKVLYASEYSIYETTANLYVDNYLNQSLIVNFL